MNISFYEEMIYNPIKQNKIKEFTETLDEIGFLVDSELYIEMGESLFEAVTNNNSSALKSFGSIASNTVSSSKQVGGAYGDITTGYGSIIKLGFDIVMTFINLIAKAVKFIFTNIPKIFEFIDNTLHKASKIPSEILAKVRGDISLYITPDDVSLFYNQIFPKIEVFIKEAKELARGNMWSSKRDRDISDKSKDKNGRNDLEHINQMEKIFRYIENLKFDKTILRMNTKENIGKIFDPEYKWMEYVLDGKKVEGSYFDVLKEIFNRFENTKNDLKIVQEDVSNKFNDTEARSQFESLDRIVQERITHTMRMIAKIVQIVGNFIRYTHKDMISVQKNLSTMLARQEAIGDKGRADDDELPVGVMPAIRRNMDEQQQNFLKDANGKIENNDNYSDIKGIKEVGNSYHFYYKNYDTKKWEYLAYNKK